MNANPKKHLSPSTEGRAPGDGPTELPQVAPLSVSGPDPFGEHKAAFRRLASELANYREKLTPELEGILSAKALVSAQAEEETDLTKLDALCIRLRSLEVREHVASVKSAESEKWMQAALPLHIERDERLAAFSDELRLRESFGLLRKHFPNSSFDPQLEGLASQTTMYVEGKIKVPLLSYAWAQSLEPFSEKRPIPGVIDPLFLAPKREDTVKCLLETTKAVLECEEALFERLKGSAHIPPFEAPAPPNADSSEYLEYNRDINRQAPSPQERLAAAQAQLTAQNQGMFAA
jgi:hypothetical protein